MTAVLLLALLPAQPAADPALVPEIPALVRPTAYPARVFDLSADGKLVVTAVTLDARRQLLRLREVATGAVTNDLPLGAVEEVTSARFSPDGKTIAVGLGSRRMGQAVRVVDAATGAAVREFDDFDGRVLVLGFSADGTKFRVLIYPGPGKAFKHRIETRDAASGKVLDTEEAGVLPVRDAVTPDGKVRVSQPKSGTVVAKAGDKTVPLDTGRETYRELFVTPDGTRAVLAALDHADVFDTATGAKVRTLREDNQIVTSVAPADGGRLLFVAVGPAIYGRRLTEGGCVLVWDTAKPELRAAITGFPANLWRVQPTPDGKRFVALCGDNWRVERIEVWDTVAKKKLHAIEPPPGRGVGQAAVSPDGNWVAHVNRDNGKPAIRVWNTATGEPAEAVTKAAAGAGDAVAFTPDSKRLVTASAAGAYAEWDLTTGKKEAGWQREAKDREFMERLGVGSITALPGGKGFVSVAATHKRRQSYVVRLVTEKKEWFLAEFWDHTSAAAVSADGRWLSVVAGNAHDGVSTFLLRLNEDGSPELVKKGERYRGPVFDGDKVIAWRAWAADAHAAVLAFSPDGTRLFTGGTGHAVRVWDVAARELKATLYAVPAAKPAGAPVDWVAFTPDAHFAASAVGAKVLRFRESGVAAWFGLRTGGTIPAADLPAMRDPEKVRAALVGK